MKSPRKTAGLTKVPSASNLATKAASLYRRAEDPVVRGIAKGMAHLMVDFCLLKCTLAIEVKNVRPNVAKCERISYLMLTVRAKCPSLR
jgi:hypothetical protein